MTRDEAVRKLWDGGQLHELAEAIGIIASDQTSPIEDILLGLHYKGFVAEQAAIALYNRTGRAIPSDRSQLSKDLQDWARWISQSSPMNQSRGEPAEVLQFNTRLRTNVIELSDLIARSLTREERLILVLYYYENLTTEQIGTILDLSTGRVSEVLGSIIARLRTLVTPEGQAMARLYRDIVA